MRMRTGFFGKIIRIDSKRFLTTNVQFWKDGKNWREMVGGKEVSDEFTLDQTIAR